MLMLAWSGTADAEVRELPARLKALCPVHGGPAAALLSALFGEIRDNVRAFLSIGQREEHLRSRHQSLWVR